nr:hypothetical protein [Actinomycetota bacterium]
DDDGNEVDAFLVDLSDLAEEGWRDYTTRWLSSKDGDKEEPTSSAAEQQQPVEQPYESVAVRNFEDLVDYAIRPHIRSGWPLYAGTENHAFLLCGRSVVNDRPVIFLHDDQNGPYLAAPTLTFLSRIALRYQSGSYADRECQVVVDGAAVDTVPEVLENLGAFAGSDVERAVHTIVAPLPPRVLLPPTAAQREAFNLVQSLLGDPTIAPLNSLDAGTASQLREVSVRTTIMMGIEYKAHRRKHARDANDGAAVLAFSGAPLAEWVIVVQGLCNEGCLWECIYDASSSPSSPRLQLVRVLDALMLDDPMGSKGARAAQLGEAIYPYVSAPVQLRKWTSADQGNIVRND